jgi:hypothetical protein
MKIKESVLRLLFTGMIILSVQSVMAQVPAQQIITGVTREEGSGKPIGNVSVFFSGTLSGTVTDSTGNFTLYPETATKLPILISGAGYESKTITDYPTDKKLVVELKTKIYDLDAVTVKADDGMSLKEKLRIFRREFLGSSPNAKNSQIMNEADLRFTYSSQTHILKATCDKPVVVQNKSLGYSLNFLLANFSFDGQQTAFYGSQFFRETAKPEEAAKVNKARKNVYLGSQLHFIRALWSNKLAQNGFEVIRYLKQDSTVAGKDKQYVARDLRRLPFDSLVVTKGNQKYLQFSGLIKITYRSQVSMMEGVGKPVAIESNGYIDPQGILWRGVIGMQRAGDLLPLEFDVEASSRVLKDLEHSASTFTASDPLDTLHERMPFEKLYLHLDKPYYSVGDTLRMKAYLLDAASGKGSEKSGIIYVELANDSNKVIFRRMLPAGFGLGTGNIILGKTIPEGSYTLRAYTNLMRNFGEGASFQKNLYVSNPISRNWLVNSRAALSKVSDKDNVQFTMQFYQLNKQPVRRRDLEVQLLDGDRIVQRGRKQTDQEGKLNVSFNLPESSSTRNMSMVAVDPASSVYKVIVPIEVNRFQNTDLQFMPEGGALVNGIASRVGFKAIGEDGNGVDVSGKVYNSTNQEVASFTSSYKGMGSFDFKPTGTGNYTAKIMMNGAEKSFPFPQVKNTGSVLRITNLAASDSVIAAVTISTSLATVAKSFYHLVGQSGGKVYFEEDIPVSGNTNVKIAIRKDLFPSGVARFTLMNPDKQPLNERVTFIDNHDNLKISVTAAKPSYKTRDNVTLAIEVKNNAGLPVEGSFSMAVTDDAQVHTDNVSANILSSMLLTSGLKGTIEGPGHYLTETAKSAVDMENLLLTQGWVGYNWNEVFTPPAAPAFPAQAEFVMNGKVSAGANKKSPATEIQLLSVRPQLLKIDSLGQKGSFTFASLPVAEDLRFFMTAKNSKGKSPDVDIQVDPFKPAVFKPSDRQILPWNVNSDTILLQQANIRALQESKLGARGTVLQEVSISAKKVVKDSRNLNGPGKADQILDEADVSKEPKKTLLNLLNEQVKGFGVGRWPSSNSASSGLEVAGSGSGPITSLQRPTAANPMDSKIGRGTVDLKFSPVMSYKIFDKELHLVIDGVDVETFYEPLPGGISANTMDPQLIAQRNMSPIGNYILERNTAAIDDRQRFIKQFLDGIAAADIKGIEVMTNPEYNNQYKEKYAWKIASSLNMISADFAYIEVTTYSGNGAFIKPPVGVYQYKPISYVNSASFYKPRYTAKSSPLSDFRSTIHWEPDITTDKDGKGTVSFYTSDRSGTYSIIMEGSDMNGNVGRQTGKVVVK